MALRNFPSDPAARTGAVDLTAPWKGGVLSEVRFLRRVMKAIRFLPVLFLPLFLSLGGCFTPVPYDQPTGYPGLRHPSGYPPNAPSRYGAPPRQGSNFPYPDQRTSRWDDPSRMNNPDGSAAQLQPQPEPEPQPRVGNREVLKPIDDPLNVKDPVKEEPKYPYGIPVKGKDNLIISPYAKDKGYIDVSGLPSGTQIECHWTKKIILVP